MTLFAIMDGHSNRSSSSSSSISAKSHRPSAEDEGGGEDGGALGQTVAARMRDAFETVLRGFPLNCLEKQPQKVGSQLANQGILVDEGLQREGLGKSSGTTFSFALVSETHIVIGNVGDSEVFYSSFEANTTMNSSRITSVESFGADQLVKQKTHYEEITKLPEECSNIEYQKLVLMRTGPSNGAEILGDGDVKLFHDDCKKLLEKFYHEYKRVHDAGGEISGKCIRLKDESTSVALAVTRAFGDFDFKSKNDLGGLDKQVVIARPSIRIIKRERNKREVLGLFTDGVAFEYTIPGYRGGRYCEPDRRHTLVDFFIETASAMNSDWDKPSLIDQSERLNAAANRHSHHNDNAGLILIKFNEYRPANHAEETAASIDDETSAKKMKSMKSG